MSAASAPRVLLTGATGFVGRHTLPALRAAGYAVRCSSRDPARAARDRPDLDWVRLDVEAPETLRPALSGCDAAVFLVHGLGQGHGDYPERERVAAEAFRQAAEAEQVRRLVYLGGVAPAGQPSRHLASRLRTGEVLRAGALDAVELRAAMVIGVESASWQITRDLARRLPAMLLPSWLSNHSWPIDVDDVVAGLLAALRLESTGPRWFDLPGPERLSHRALLRRVTTIMGRRPLLVGIPVLTPRLSSYWIGAVTRAGFELARELVEGLRWDLDPTGDVLWDQVAHELVPLDTSIARALEEERFREDPCQARRERLAAIGRAFAVA